MPNPIKQHSFNFKGFSTFINDDVADEQGNHLIVGEIRAVESQAENRDTMINRICNLKGYSNDDPAGIIIITDKDYKTKRIVSSFIGEKILYNPIKKQFTIGALFLDYLHVGNESFSAWQPVIIQTDFELKFNICFIQRPYSCILENIVMENDEVIIFARSEQPKITDKNSEKGEVIRIAPNRVHRDSVRPWIPIADILMSIQTPYSEIGTMTLSDISKVDNSYYFTTSNLNQFTLKNINHLYQFRDNKLIEIPDFPDYLKMESLGSDWININDFTVNSNKNYLFLTHQGATNKEMSFTKTDQYINTLLSKKILLNDYADFNKMLIMPNGNIIILNANKTEMWSYHIYNAKMELLKEINSNIPKDYYPKRLKVIDNNHIEGLFYIHQVNKKDCILQTVYLES